MHDLSLDHARRLDAADPLTAFRDAFHIPDPDLIYLDGNSLGRLPKATRDRLHQVVDEEWGAGLIRGWNRGWYEAPQRIGDKIAPLVGAAPGQIVACDSTSINLYKLVMAALALRPDRPRIVSDVLNFPSDLYIVQGCLAARGGGTLHLVPSLDGETIPTEMILDAIDETTALVTLTHVAFKSGWMHDAATITQHAHAQGALVLWDLSHSVGAVPVELDGWDADFAVGCAYKYLNGGPGAPAFLYVRQAHQAEARSPIWGWFGQHNPFGFGLDFAPAAGLSRFLVGTPPLLALLAVEPALDLMNQAGMARLRTKSLALSEWLIALADARLNPLGFTLGSPRDGARRGSHVSLRHPAAYPIARALIEEMNVLPDFRAPDNIRLGLAPLYNTFTEVWEAVERIARVVEEGRHARYIGEQLAVT